MKFYEYHFNDYISSEYNAPLHPKLHKQYDSFPKDIKDLKNIIFYGPKGVGKYTQMLRSIVKYSPSKLKYDRKIINSYGKSSYILKISDVHFEVDMSLLGCNSKCVWNDVYHHIIDVVFTKPNHTGIIVCKYFHEIHSELLDCFYSYMQTCEYKSLDIKFILLTEEISFIPDCIVDTCRTIRVPRPTKQQYNKCILKPFKKDIVLNEITNIKNINSGITQLMRPYEVICKNIISMITIPEQLKYIELRDSLYDLLIYSLDITECIWYILTEIIKKQLIQEQQITDVLLQTYKCLQYYNNNYRPIYHLESFIFYLVNKIHGF
jgi:Cdc6-like AAA superfamily ATPase